ncbi:serine/threonine protein kinase domain protein [Blumeria hordei DH14]|uniref:non-specific serine/threonine protein kinase n=1 Tax=Blumeria graminis f. sp. hordei (strain DH14) TaxID=546991 RepID=N1J4U4_BLUG1|nr:serine/threonine protein kinase domain protein [Blumeria hordei DH14]
MSLTSEMETYLAKHPLEQILDTFHDVYHANFYKPCDTVFAKPKNSNKYLNPVRCLMDGFLNYVNRSPLIPEVTNNIQSRLTVIAFRIASTSFDLAPFEPLASLILTDATDIEVWKSLLQLADTLESIFASQEIKEENLAAKSIFRRARTTQACTEQKMESLKQLLHRELHGSVYINVQGFWKKYFTNKLWVDNCIDLAKEFVKRSTENDLKFPETPTKKLVWNWTEAVEKKIFQSPSKTCTTSITASSSTSGGDEHHFNKTQFRTTKTSEFNGGQTARQVDYFIIRRGLPTSNLYHWRDVLVLGEFTESTQTVFMDKLLQLSMLMRELFFAQPLRQFAHGFHLFKKVLLLWVYDRSGSYCGSFIDIGKSPQTLVYVMAAYMSMSDAELGLYPHINYEAHHITITLDVPGVEEKREFKLSPEPDALQTSLVSRGSSFYHTLEGECAVKFSRRMCGHNSEAELLKLAKGIDGMADLMGSRDFVKISDLRKDLIFTNKMVKNTLPVDKATATPLSFTDDTMLRKNKSTSVVVARKRKCATSDSVTETGRSSKRSKTSHGPSFTRNTITEGILTVSLNAIIEEEEPSIPANGILKKTENSLRVNAESIGEKRKSSENDEVNGGIKRLHLSSKAVEASSVQDSAKSAVPSQDENARDILFISREGDFEVKTDNVDGYTVGEDKFAETRDRHLSAVAITPYGRSLHKVESSLELVTVLRDAIKAHWSLGTKAKILHRDISANNIIMTGSEAHKNWNGYFIDVDLAVLLTDGKAQDKRQAMTGTMEFMALEILSGSCETTGAVVEHSYRHDLESFFYVFLWQCLSCGLEDGKEPNTEYLKKWYTGTAKEIFDFKKTEIESSHFTQQLLPRFPLKFQNLWNLAMAFRKILFLPHGVFYIGSQTDNNDLYNATMKAFEKAIHLLTRYVIFSVISILDRTISYHIW